MSLPRPVFLSALFFLFGCSSGGEITGSATLPDCNEAPAGDLSGGWFDQGTVTVTSGGCEGFGIREGTVRSSCPLNWNFVQDGNDVAIDVDEEYRLRGRFCGDVLYLEGGWWLPVQDDNGQCNYDDDDGDEVGIEEGGSTLSYTMDATSERLFGTLVVEGSCSGEYVVEFNRR